MLYLMWILLQPMNVPYAWSLYFFAILISLFFKASVPVKTGTLNKTISFLAGFAEEECMNLFLMVFLVPGSRLVKTCVHFCLGIWALMHVCVMAEDQLEQNPETIGLSALQEYIEWVNHSRVEMAIFKCKCEILVAVFSIPFVLFS